MKRAMLGLLLATPTLAGVGCHHAITDDQIRSATAQKTGCAPGSVEIRDAQRKKAPYTWTAACEGRVFSCTSANQGECLSSGMPAQRQEAAGAPPPAM